VLLFGLKTIMAYQSVYFLKHYETGILLKFRMIINPLKQSVYSICNLLKKALNFAHRV
jgi:hypothetical protein